MKLRSLALVLAVASVSVGAQTPAAPAAAASGPTLRAEITPAMLAAQKALGEKKYDEAMQHLRAAQAVPGQTPYEAYAIDRFRALASAGLGDMPQALQAYEAVLASPFLEPELRAPLMEQAANAAYGLKDWAKAALWGRRAVEQGASGTGTRLRLAQALYFQGQHAEAATVLNDLATRQRGSGEAASESQLRLQASNHAKLNDEAGYAATLELLLARFPKPEIWADRLSRLSSQAGFDDRLALDALRLGQQVKAWTTPEPLLALADAAQRAGFVAEASRVVETGFERGVLGQGAKAAEHQALRQKLQKQLQADLAPDAKAAAGRDAAYQFTTGWDLASRGQAADGIALMQQALQRGLPKQADDARLRLAGALAAAGRADEARPLLTALRDGGAKDGLADLARLWLIAITPRS